MKKLGAKKLLLLLLIFTTTITAAQQIGLPGSQFVDADLFDADGNCHHIADFRGKTVIINFIGSNQTACTLATSDMWHYFAQADSSIVLISISNQKFDKWITEVKDENLPWLCLNDKQEQNGIFAKYKLQYVPNFYIISPDGKIKYRCKNYDPTFFCNQAKSLNINQPIRTENKNITTIDKPNYDKWSYFTPYHIEQITITPQETQIEIFAFCNNNIKLKSFSSTIQLTTKSGDSYKLIKAEGINLDAEKWNYKLGENKITLIFEPIPTDCDEVSINSITNGKKDILFNTIKLK